jgi:hypothetical protein
MNRKQLLRGRWRTLLHCSMAACAHDRITVAKVAELLAGRRRIRMRNLAYFQIRIKRQ